MILRHSSISREQVKASLIRYDAVLLISEQIMQRYEQYLEKCAETWEATKRTIVSNILQTEQSIKHLSSKIIIFFLKILSIQLPFDIFLASFYLIKLLQKRVYESYLINDK